MSHEAPIDYTPVVTDLGPGSTVVLSVSSAGSDLTTSYRLTKMSTASPTFKVEAVNDLPASGPPIEFTSGSDDLPTTFVSGDILKFKGRSDDSASMTLGILADLVVIRKRR